MILRSHGGILIAVLVFTFVIALVLAGIGELVVSHSMLGIRTRDRSAALQLAEAGVNYELWWMSQNTADPNLAHQAHPAAGQNGAYTGSIAGVPGSFTVSVSNDPDNGSAWYAPATPLITCRGVVNGMPRTVQVRAPGKGMFDNFPIFGVNSITVSGSGSRVIGRSGTDGPVIVNSGAGATAFIGSLTYFGTATTLTGSNIRTQPNTMYWPTIDQIAQAAFPAGGLAWLKINNNNDSLKQFNPNRLLDPLFSVANAVSAGLTKTTYTLNSQTTKNLTIDLNPLDIIGGARYATSIEGLLNQNVLIFPPGDYYFEDFSAPNGKGAILFDTASGRIRIWIGGPGSSKDDLSATSIFTSPDPARFRIYYGKGSELSIGGNSTFYGGVYASSPGSNASVKLAGGAVIDGSVIAQLITLSGNSLVQPPASLNVDPSDFALWYGFTSWKEIP